MSNVLEYKGYTAKIKYDVNDHILYGKLDIVDYVNFHSDSISGIEDAFHEAVDEYLFLCKENDCKPDECNNALFDKYNELKITADKIENIRCELYRSERHRKYIGFSDDIKHIDDILFEVQGKIRDIIEFINQDL